MKQKLLTFFLFFLIVGLTPVFAEDNTTDSIEVTLNVNDPDHLEVSLQGDSILTLKAGANIFKVTPWTNIKFTAQKGYILDKVVDLDGNEQTITDYQSTCTVMIADSPQKCSYTVTTSPVADIHFSMLVDHAEKVKVIMADYTPLTIVDGENALSVPSNKLPVFISAANWGDSFYEVLIDGQAVPYNYGYSVTPHEGSVVKVTTEFPDKDCTLSFELPAGIDNFFTAVAVNDSIVRDYADGLTVKAGNNVKLYYNPSFWSSDPEQAVCVTVNGDTTSWFGPGYQIVMRDNTVVKVEQATAVPTIRVKVKINKDNVATIYRSSETYYDTVSMKANVEQEVELPEDEGNKIVVEVDNDDEEIKGVSLNGEPVTLYGSNYAEIGDLVDGDQIAIFMKNDTPDGIETVNATQKTDQTYNLLGQKLGRNAQVKGLVIKNGKKVILH